MSTYTNNRSYREDLLAGKTTCEATVSAILEKIKQHQHLNAYLEVYEEEALQAAKAIDQKVQSGASLGKLAGMVIALKDNICFKDHKITASSKILGEFTSLYSATATERLLAEDAIIIGRTNCDEFAMGSSNENSAFGTVLNNADNTLVSGGSSGGSAVAVQAGLCHASLGSDTGGSIRQPAAFCGTVGLKPTYGRISRHGLIAFGSSFDQIGPFTNNAYDAALLLEVMAGQDKFDSTVSHKEVPEYSATLASDKKLQIAYFPEITSHEGVAQDINEKFEAFKSSLLEQGHELSPVDFEYMDYMIPSYYVMATAEASSNLARYDGIRYGNRNMDAEDLAGVYKQSRTEGFGKEVKRRIMLGTFVLSSGYYDAYYSKAQKVRRLLQQKVNAIFENYDCIISPTTPTVAFKIGEKEKDPVEMYLSDIFTVLANLTGHPAISMPLYENAAGLPIGMQAIGRSFDESTLLAFAHQQMQ